MPEIAAAPRVYHHPDLAGMLRNVIYFAGEGRPDFLLLYSQNRPWQKWSGAESRSSASYVVFLLPADKKVPLMKAWKEACLVIGLLLVIEKWTGVVEGSTSTILIALREKHATEIPALTFGSVCTWRQHSCTDVQSLMARGKTILPNKLHWFTYYTELDVFNRGTLSMIQDTI